MSTTERYVKRPTRRTAIAALVLAVVGAAVAYGGFVTGIDATLSGHGPGFSIITFFVGAGILVAAVVMATIGLLRTTAKLLSTTALVIGLLPIAGLLVAALSLRR